MLFQAIFNNMPKLSLLFTAITLSIRITYGQTDQPTPLHNAGFFGYSTYMPDFGNKGYKALGPWQGVELNVGMLNFAFYEGALRGVDADSTVASTSGNLYRLGVQLGKRFELGNSSFTSISVEPFLRVAGSLAQIPTVNVSDNVASSGLVFSPGILFKASHLYVSATYDAGLYLVTTPSRVNRQYSAARGFLGGWSFTVGLDNAFDLLMPEAFTARGYDINKEIYQDRKEKYDVTRDEFYTEITTTTYTTYTPGKRELSLMSPFWGIGPSYSFSALQNRQAATAMRGVTAGVRIWYAMVDGFYEQGQLGLKDQVGKDPILINYPQLRDYDFSAQVEARKYGGRIGFNLTKFFALKLNYAQNSSSKRRTELAVPFLRIHGFYTAGMVDFLAPPKYTYGGASARLVELQGRLGVSPDASNNPDFLPESVFFQGLGINVEVGSMFFNTTWYRYQDAAIADHNHHTVGGHIPLDRIFNSLRTRYFIK